MGREVRMVPKGWEHPKDWRGNLKPLRDTPVSENGKRRRECDPDEYMPPWPAEERTHFMMYEDTTEGTPISPAFETPEELARWLADNGASSFGRMTATYEEWLETCRGGWAPSMVMDANGLRSGAEFMAEKKP